MKLLVVVVCLLCTPLVSATYHQGRFAPKLYPETRIIGGEEAHTGQFPFVAAIYLRTDVGRYFCGGALLTKEYVLTAGQCVNGAISFQISFGSIYISQEDVSRVTVNAEESVLHPDFSLQPDLVNDIGAIRLVEPIQFSNYIQAIHYLPFADIPGSAPIRIMGWGQISNDQPAPVDALNWALLTTITNAQCALIFGDQVKEDMGCIAGNFNEGTCIGDTGSPLVQIVSQAQVVFIGVASWYSYNGCDSTDPSGYTRIFPHVDWIRNVTGF